MESSSTSTGARESSRADRGITDEFRVEVEDRRKVARFVLHPATGSDAIEAFYHPFAPRDAPFTGIC
jgi:hypothetical protein